MKSIILYLLSTSIWCAGVIPKQLFAQPQRPTIFNTSFSLPQGAKTYRLSQGDDLQAAINNASLGDVLILDAGATFTGNFKLPQKTGNGWIYIISSELAALPERRRVEPADSIYMPKIESPNIYPAIATNYGAHHYRLAGIDIRTSVTNLYLVSLGYDGGYNNPASQISDLPSFIWFDRCLIHQIADDKAARTGISANGIYNAVFDCYIANFKDSGSVEGYGILIDNGDGPYKFVNNFIEASSQNFFIGGTAPTITGSIPGDIEFRGNYCYKRDSFKTAPQNWMIKNLFELKIGQRVLIDSNVFENVPEDNAGQNAAGIALTVRASGEAPWTVLQDITFTNNIVRHVGLGFRITGMDDVPTQQTKRILIKNNLIEYLETSAYLTPKAMILTTGKDGAPILDLTVTNNLFLHNGWGSSFIQLEGSNTKLVDNFVYRNNIVTHGTYGLIATGTTEGKASLDAVTSPYTFQNNILVLRSVDTYHAIDLARTEMVGSVRLYKESNSFYPYPTYAPDGMDEVGCVEFSSANYRLSSSSSYINVGTEGSVPGPNWDILELATAHCKDGQSHPPILPASNLRIASYK